MGPTKALSEEDWRARDDAHALATAEEVKADPNRLQRAKAAAKDMVQEEEERLTGLRKAARGSAGQQRSPSTPPAKKARNLPSAAPSRNVSKGTAATRSNFNVFKRI